MEVDLNNIQVRRIILEGIPDLNLEEGVDESISNELAEFLTVKVLIDVRVPRFDFQGNRAVFILREEVSGKEVFCVNQSNYDEVKQILEKQGMKIDLTSIADDIIDNVDWHRATNILRKKNGK